MSSSLNRGFTLIELLIVVTVLAVLGTLAVTTYRDYVLRSGRSEAMTALMEVAQLEEQYFANRQSYTGSLSDLNYSTTTPGGLYQLQLATSAAVHYSIQATALNGQRNDVACRTFTLTGLGERSAHDSGGTDTTGTCWGR